jgi:hypothetical protein
MTRFSLPYVHLFCFHLSLRLTEGRRDVVGLAEPSAQFPGVENTEPKVKTNTPIKSHNVPELPDVNK